MKKFVPFRFQRAGKRGLPVFALLGLPMLAQAQSIEKMADFRNVIVNSTYVSGSSNPYDNAVQVGNRLWFTTQTGGANGFGTISSYDLTTHAITALASMDTVTGNTPLSSVTPIGNQLYFTTTRGGTGDTGTLASVDMTAANSAITPVYNFGASTTATNPRNPSGGFTAVDRGAGGTDLYFTTPNGGTGGAAYGTISRFNTLTNSTSVVYNFTGTGTANGRQPMEGFTKVGNNLYFTTFTGGANAGTGFPNGTGTVSVLDTTTNAVSTLASLPSGGSQFPSHNVTAANGMLYFTTTGNATQPGTIQSFNITTGTLSTVYTLTGAATSSGPFPDGRFAYGSVLALNNVLYFTTIQGGTYNRGTIDAFNLNTNTFSKLYDLDGGTADNLSYLGQEARGGFTLVNENGQDYLYLLTRAGGLYNSGTLLRITPLAVPEPSTVAMLLTAGAGGCLWRRRRNRRGPSTPRESVPQPVPQRQQRQRAFTLLELLIVVGIIAVLTALVLPVYGSVTDKGREAACLSNLRQIGTAYLSYAQDHGGYFPSADTMGNSSYRSIDDPLGLPMLFIPYLGSEYKNGKEQGSKIWLCPGGRPSLKSYGANYAWTRADNILGKPMMSIDHLSTTVLLWDNFTMTLPSIMNIPEGTAGGPRAASEQYRYYAHRTRTKANYLYADGHAGTL